MKTVTTLAFAALAYLLALANIACIVGFLAEFGNLYRRYRKEVPAFIPWM